MNLFDLSQTVQKLADALEAAEADGLDVTEAVSRYLAEAGASLELKVEGIVRLIRENEALAKACAEEAKAMQTKAGVFANRAKRLHAYLQDWMIATGKDQFQAGLFRLSVQANGGAAPVSIVPGFEPEMAPERFVRTKVSFDMDAIRQAIANGESVGFAELAPRGRHLRIT